MPWSSFTASLTQSHVHAATPGSSTAAAITPGSPIRIFIVDDHAMFREGLLRLLEHDPRLRVVGEAAGMDEALEALRTLEVDVLMLDYDLGEHTAPALVRRLRERAFAGRILLVTAGLPPHEALDLVRLGVSGIVHKQHSPTVLVDSIVEAAQGKLSIDPAYLQRLLEATPANQPPPLRLTEREREVMRLLLEGSSNKEIAARLRVSESAVKASMQQLFTKTGVRTRSQLVRIALESPLLTT